MWYCYGSSSAELCDKATILILAEVRWPVWIGPWSSRVARMVWEISLKGLSKFSGHIQKLLLEFGSKFLVHVAQRIFLQIQSNVSPRCKILPLIPGCSQSNCYIAPGCSQSCGAALVSIHFWLGYPPKMAWELVLHPNILIIWHIYPGMGLIPLVPGVSHVHASICGDRPNWFPFFRVIYTWDLSSCHSRPLSHVIESYDHFCILMTSQIGAHPSSFGLCL
jgi:hypothetical protein